MARGVYQGADTMEATRVQSLWDVLQGQKRHRKETEGELGKRALASSFGDIIKTISPGYGHVAELGIDQLSQQMFKLPEYEEEDDSSFWGSSQIAEYGEQAEEIRSGADTSLLEGIIGGVGDYVGVGTDKENPLEGFFDVESETTKRGRGGDVAEAGGVFSSEGFGTLLGFKNGGRVPKYEKGGGIFKGFGKKKKVPERDEALVALDAILSKDYEKKEGKYEYPMGYTQSQDWAQEDGINLLRVISQFSTPEGERYYPGEGKSRSSSLGQTKAMMDAASRAFHSPADSITTDQLAKFKELGLFAGGGMVNGESSSPSIVDYFSAQGKTLGGSNTQSLAKKLGRI